jgi:hypothetical protein
LAIAAAVVVAVSVGLFMFYPWRPAANASITEWRSPTDFLLQTPGHELLEGVPRIGQWPDEFLRSRPTATPSGKKKS